MSFKYIASPKSLETTWTNKETCWTGWERIDGGVMVNLFSGESRVFQPQQRKLVDCTQNREVQKHDDSRIDNFGNLRKTIQYAKMLLECNENKKALFVTLTYRTKKNLPMTDTTKLYADCKQFFKNLKRKKINDVEYFIAREPQKNGSWHCHCILYSPTLYDMFWAKGTYEKKYKKRQSIERTKNKVLVDLLCGCWSFANPESQGVDITCPRSVTAYLTSYLTKDLYHEEGKKKQMLSLYPKGFRPFVWSRNLERPLVSERGEHIYNFLPYFVEVRRVQKTYEVEGCSLKVEYRTYVNKDLHKKVLHLPEDESNIGLMVADNAEDVNLMSIKSNGNQNEL